MVLLPLNSYTRSPVNRTRKHHCLFVDINACMFRTHISYACSLLLRACTKCKLSRFPFNGHLTMDLVLHFLKILKSDGGTFFDCLFQFLTKKV